MNEMPIELEKDNLTGKDILNIPVLANDAEASTIGEYLIELLRTLWTEGEGFSGKRPFGNSGWEYELYTALVSYGAVEGEVTEYGVNCYDTRKANQLIFQAIETLYTKE